MCHDQEYIEYLLRFYYFMLSIDLTLILDAYKLAE